MDNANYDQLPDWCWGVLKTSNEIIIIKKGETGYYKTDYLPAKSLEAAEKWCNEINERMGVSKEVRKAMEWGSMAGWDSPLANPDIWKK